MMRAFRGEFAKYFVAGTLAFLSDFALFLTLTKGLGIHYLIANAAGFCVGLTVSYLFCVKWVFSERTYATALVEFPIFAGVSAIMLLVGELLMLLLVETVQLPPPAAKIVMTGMIFIGNFLLKKFLLFRSKTNA